MDTTDIETDKGTTELQIQQAALHRPSVGIDVDYYQSVIDDPEVCEDRKRDLIELIGTIVLNFIDIGFGVHPVQLAMRQSGKLAQDNKRVQLDERETPPLQIEFEKENHPERDDL